MENKKIGFFRRIFLAITDFRLYPQILKERTFKAIGYFLKLILLSSFFISLYLLTNTLDFISNDMNDYAKKIPDFYIENGEMYFDEEAKVELNAYLNLYMKNEYSNDLKINFVPSDNLGIIVTKDKVLFGNSSESSTLIEYSELQDISKQDILDTIDGVSNSLSSKVFIFAIIFVSVVFYMLINRIWLLLMYILIVLICNILFVIKVKFRGFLKIAIYISTLPILLETFAICVGGKYNQTAEFITFLIAGVYAFYALRYIRISDALNRASRKYN